MHFTVFLAIQYLAFLAFRVFAAFQLSLLQIVALHSTVVLAGVLSLSPLLLLNFQLFYHPSFESLLQSHLLPLINLTPWFDPLVFFAHPFAFLVLTLIAYSVSIILVALVRTQVAHVINIPAY